MKDYNARIINMNYLNKNVVEITFKIEHGKKMEFTPGQFVILEVSETPSIKRAYSVLDYNPDTNEMKLGIKKVEGGQATSIIFNDFEVGINVRISKARGKQLVVNKASEGIVLIATGIGVTPMFCVLKDLIKTNYSGDIDFIYGVRTSEELYYKDDIQSLVDSNRKARFHPVLSEEKVEGIHKGYVTDVLHHVNLDNKHIYLCGPKIVESLLKDNLSSRGFDMRNFRCESA